MPGNGRARLNSGLSADLGPPTRSTAPLSVYDNPQTGTAYERLIDRIRNQGKPVRDSGREVRTACPAHEGDNRESLVIYNKPGKAKVVCWAGCDDRDVLAVLGFGIGDLYDDVKVRTVQRVDQLAPVPPVTKTRIERVLDRLLSLPDLGERLCRCIARREEIATAHAAADYWSRRADRFRSAGDLGTAQACLNKAAFLLWETGEELIAPEVGAPDD
jgi:hypothetical protein